MWSEKVFLNEAGVFVSSVRFVAPGCSFAIGDLLWRTVRKVPGRWRWPQKAVLLICCGVGLLLAAVGAISFAVAPFTPGPDSARAVALLVAAGSLALGVRLTGTAMNDRYHRLDQFRLVVGVGGAEVTAFSDADEALVRRVARALAEAVSRS